MSKLIRYLVITFILFIISTNAQEIEKTGGFARLTGMGANPFVTDPFLVTLNPAWGRVYDNFLMGDLGSSAGAPFSAGGAGQFIAGIFSLDNQWTLGGLLTRSDFNGASIALLDPGASFGVFPGVVNTVNNIVGTGSVISLDNNVELMGTFTTGTTTIGLGVAYASTTNDFTPDTGSASKGSAGQIGVNLGFLSDIASGFKVDAGVSILFPNASYMPPTGSETKASQTIIIVNARGFLRLKQNLYLVPIAGFLTESGTVEPGGTSTSSVDLISFTMFGGGVGMNYSVGDFLLAGGVSLALTNQTIPAVDPTPELKNSSFIFPAWNIGGEWNIADWLIARMGYIAVTGRVTDKTTNYPVEWDYTFFLPPQRGFTVGVGFRLDNFSLDATINEDVLRQGLNNIGGGGATFAYLSTSYALP